MGALLLAERSKILRLGAFNLAHLFSSLLQVVGLKGLLLGDVETK